MHLPACIFYPFVKWGGKIFGKFNIEETSPEEQVKNSRLPIIFIHGDKDHFVPYEMSEKNYRACTSECALEIFEGASHGASFLVDPERYFKVLKDFEKHYNW